MLTSLFPPDIGGPGTQCFHLCRTLLERGVTPVVITYGQTFSVANPHGYRVYRFQRTYGLGPLDAVIRWLVFPPYLAVIFRREKVDILHCHSINTAVFLAALIAKLTKIPRVVKFAGDWVWETLSARTLQQETYLESHRRSFLARLLAAFQKLTLRLFDVIWVPSEFRRENVRALLGDERRIVHIPNSLYFDDAGAPGRPRGGEVVAVSASQFIPRKRLPLLVEVFAEATEPGTKLILIGGGNSQEVRKVKDTIERLRLKDRVELTGIIPSKEVYAIFRRASFYVSASFEEGFPNVFIEAMHYGLPIVATDVGGCRELVIDGETGFLVPRQDTTALVDRMRRLINDPLLRDRMSHKAHERSEKFDLRHTIKYFMAMYESLLGAKTL